MTMEDSAIAGKIAPSTEACHGALYDNPRGIRNLETAVAMFWSAWEMKQAWFRTQHPDWSEEQIKRAVRDWILYARS